MWLFLLAGPMTILLASVLAIWRPLWAGIWLMLGGVASAVLAVVVMTPTPETWTPGGDSLGFYAFKWSLTLIIPFSLPMLVLGLWLTNKFPWSTRFSLRTLLIFTTLIAVEAGGDCAAGAVIAQYCGMSDSAARR
jgi:hypothetical protein